jgi:hypothetical protein
MTKSKFFATCLVVATVASGLLLEPLKRFC